MQEYVLGFLINPHHDTVALIEKQKPDWQRGRLNGIGGKIEPGEHPNVAMAREFEEEAGCQTNPEDWRRYAILEGVADARDGSYQPWRIHIFVTYHAAILQQIVKTTTIERVGVFAISMLPNKVLPNLRWLIPMALSMEADRAQTFHINEAY